MRLIILITILTSVGCGFIWYSQKQISNCTYVNEVIADHPVAYLRLGETSGTTAYEVNGQYNGTYNGVYSLAQTGALAYDSNLSATFDGLPGSYVQINSTPNLTDTATFEFWVKALNSEVRVLNYVVAASAAKWAVWVGGSGFTKTLGLHDGVVVSQGPPDAFTNSDIGIWRHIVVSYDKNTSPRTTFYKDGTLLATAVDNFSGTIAATTSMRIASRVDLGGLSWAGNVDEVAIYNYVLPATRISTHYSMGLNPSCR